MAKWRGKSGHRRETKTTGIPLPLYPPVGPSSFRGQLLGPIGSVDSIDLSGNLLSGKASQPLFRPIHNGSNKAKYTVHTTSTITIIMPCVLVHAHAHDHLFTFTSSQQWGVIRIGIQRRRKRQCSPGGKCLLFRPPIVQCPSASSLLIEERIRKARELVFVPSPTTRPVVWSFIAAPLTSFISIFVNWVPRIRH